MSRVCLPQRDTPCGLATRARHLSGQRALYDWAHVPGLPPFCRDLPKPELFSHTKRERFEWDLRGSAMSSLTSLLATYGRPLTKLSDYDRFYWFRRKPSVAERWMQDREFARQRLDGVNPLLLRRIREIPPKMPVTEHTVRGVLPDGVTLEALREEGRLYLLDFEALQGCPLVLGRFQMAAIALFWLDERDTLMPLAIQLGQDPAEAPILFTPKDDLWLWLLARTFVQCADATYHELIAHLTRTHLAMEPVWVAASRTLPPEHPLHMLLRPHFTDTLNINHDARTSLLAPGGPIDEAIAVGSEGGHWLVNQTWKTWSFDLVHPKADIERRDMMDIPGFHYRDDALRMHATIETYISELLPVFYRTNEDVTADTELQAWAHELQSPEGGQLRGIPGEGVHIQTRDQLKDLLTGIIWTVSGEHSALNNGQWDQFGYVPNSPGALYVPPPTTRDPLPKGTFVYALPPELPVDEQLALVHLLSMPTRHPIGDYDEDFFQGVPAAQDVVDRFGTRLVGDAVAIEARNASLRIPYTYLDPRVVGRSIAI